MTEKITRMEAAAAVEEILITPRVLNAERYAKLIDELGSLVRAAAAQSGAMSAAAEDLRIAQVTAARTLEELRTRSETLGRSVSMIDQRLARNESLLARASEQVQAAQEAAARVERLASADFGAAEQRLIEAERGATERLEAMARSAIADVCQRADQSAAAVEAIARDSIARATAGAAEAAHRAAERAATGAAEAVVKDAESRFRADLEERASAIRRAQHEQMAGATAALDRAASDGAAAIDQVLTNATERISSESTSCMEACAAASRDLGTLVERAEALIRPETLEPVRALANALGTGIEGAERAHVALNAALARAEEACAAVERSVQSAEGVGRAPTPEPAGNLSADAMSELEARSQSLLSATEENLRGATLHAERLGAWLGHLLGHAQQAASALDASVRRAEAAHGQRH